MFEQHPRCKEYAIQKRLTGDIVALNRLLYGLKKVREKVHINKSCVSAKRWSVSKRTDPPLRCNVLSKTLDNCRKKRGGATTFQDSNVDAENVLEDL